MPPKKSIASVLLSTPKSTQGQGRPFRTIEDYKNDALRMQSNRETSKRENFEKIAPSPPTKHLPDPKQAKFASGAKIDRSPGETIHQSVRQELR